MSRIIALCGSPSANSRTQAVTELVAQRLHRQGHRVSLVPVRDLPPGALVRGDASNRDIAAVVDAIAGAEGVIVASPVYKASYSGLLKSLLDLLSQFALAGKTVLPIATGGSLAHVLAIDYAFRPMLNSLGADHVVPGYFVFDKLVTAAEGGVTLDIDAERSLLSVVDFFSESLHRRCGLVAAS